MKSSSISSSSMNQVLATSFAWDILDFFLSLQSSSSFGRLPGLGSSISLSGALAGDIFMGSFSEAALAALAFADRLVVAVAMDLLL